MYSPMEAAFRKFLRANSYTIPRTEHDKWDKFMRFESTYNDLMEVYEAGYEAGEAASIKKTKRSTEGMTTSEFVAIFGDSVGG
jgi:phage antirepressor YoqD-like protein